MSEKLFDTSIGLVPVCIQETSTKQVLHIAWMNLHAYQQTISSGVIQLFLPDTQKTHAFTLANGTHTPFISIEEDLYNNGLIIWVKPEKESPEAQNKEVEITAFLSEFQNLLHDRKIHPVKGSYISKLFKRGVNRISKKVGEESVELVIEAVSKNKKLFKEEAADLLFFYMVLLTARKVRLEDILRILKERHQKLFSQHQIDNALSYLSEEEGDI